MATDPIRDLLAGIEPAVMIPTPPDMVAIPRERVVNAGGDPEEVKRWVDEHGGYEEHAVAEGPPQVGGGETFGREEAVRTPYYVVPKKVLEG